MKKGTKTSCVCKKCQEACKNKPGWFKPGEVEKVAEHLGISIKALFRDNLGVDWWEADLQIDHNVFVLAPAIVGHKAGEEYPGNPKGKCCFYKNGRCSIHPVKPYECREYVHNDNGGYHRKAAEAWDKKKHQAYIRKLLGREPETAPYESTLSWYEQL